MNNSVLLELRNRVNHREVTDPFQIDMTANVDALSSYLSELLKTNSAYSFFYQDNRMMTTLKDLVEQFKIGTENRITLDYLDYKEQQPEIYVALPDVPVTLVFYQGKLGACFYNAKIEFFDDQLQSINIVDQNIHNMEDRQLRLLASSEKNIYYANTHTVKNAETNEIVATTEDEIECIAAYNDYLAVSIDKNAIFLISGEDMVYNKEKNNFHYMLGENKVTLKANGIIKSLKTSKRKVVWVESYNKIAKYNKKTGSTTYYTTEFIINNIGLNDEVIFASTSNGQIIKIENDVMTLHKIGNRFSNKIVVTEDLIIVSSQYNVVGYSINSFEERFCLFFDLQVNSLAAGNGMIYIGVGYRICAYSIARILYK